MSHHRHGGVLPTEVLCPRVGLRESSWRLRQQALQSAHEIRGVGAHPTKTGSLRDTKNPRFTVYPHPF